MAPSTAPHHHQFGPAFGLTECGSDPLGGGSTTGHFLEGRNNSRFGEPALPDDLGLGPTGSTENLVAQLHNDEVKTFLPNVKNNVVLKRYDFVYPLGMTEPKSYAWAQCPRFRELVDRWFDEHLEGKRTDLALALKTTPGALKQYLNGTQKPGRNRVVRMASVLRCEPSDLMDDVDIDNLNHSPSSSDRRFTGQLMADIINAPDLSDEDIKYLYGKLKEDLKHLRGLKARIGE